MPDVIGALVDELIREMPWSTDPRKSDLATVDIRRNHSDDIEFWSELWEQSARQDPVCDVSLALDDGTEMKVHWCVLLLCPYFKALHSSGLYEQKSGKLAMNVASADVVRLVIEFLYRGKVSIPIEKIKDVIQCADYLQIDNLKYRCADYIRDHKLDYTNCVTMCSLASTYNLERLYDESNKVLRTRFKDVIVKDDILQIEPDSLKFLVGDQNLRYVGQLELFKLLVRWTEYKEERKQKFHELFDVIDLHDMTIDELENIVMSTSLIKEDCKCVDKLEKHIGAVRAVGGSEVGEDCKDVLLFTCGQKPSPTKNGDSRVRSTACYGYVVQDDRWVRLSNVPRQMCGTMAVKKDDLRNQTDVYILGKEENTVFVRLYKLPRKEVKDYWLLCSLEQPRTSTDEVYAAVFCKEKLVSVRRDNLRLFVCCHNPNAPSETSVKNLMFIRSVNEVSTVRVSSFKEKFVFIMILTNRGCNTATKTLILDTQNNILDIPETKGACTGEIFYQDGEKIYLETPGKRFSSVFCTRTRRWTSVRRGIPALPGNVTLTKCQSLKLHHDIYVLGYQQSTDKSPPCPELYRLRDQVWERLLAPSGDIPLCQASMAHFAIPRELLRCPYDCTHCASKFGRSEFAYDRYGPDDESGDEDEEDSSFYGGYSDSDDDDFGYAPGFFFW